MLFSFKSLQICHKTGLVMLVKVHQYGELEIV